jgi:hypothetical protein
MKNLIIVERVYEPLVIRNALEWNLFYGIELLKPVNGGHEVTMFMMIKN